MIRQVLFNAKIITPFITIEQGYLVLSGKKISFVGRQPADALMLADELRKADRQINMEGKILLPGYIDIHTHGALGKDYSFSPDLVFEDSVFRASKGVTGFLPTIGCFVPPESMLASAKQLTSYLDQPMKGAKPLGINMEGPFLHPDLGAQDKANCFREVNLNFLRRVVDETGSAVRIMTISPELPRAVDGINLLALEGIVPAIGHTLASEEELDRAIRAGAGLVTHLLNTTYQPAQDVKGIVKTGVNEYLLLRDDTMAEFICDSSAAHINRVMLKILMRCKSAERLILISDSFMTPGLEEGTILIMPDGREMMMKNGVNYQTKTNHITGSAMTMDTSVERLIQFTGISLKDASLMVSYNPARILGLDKRKGSLEAGKDADIIALDDLLAIRATFVEGNLVFNKL